MASTRNKNMRGEYCLQQVSYKSGYNYNLYEGKRQNNIALQPCAGINIGQIPANQLSHNSTDIESFLLGINSSNLVKAQPKFTAQINCIQNLSFYNRLQPSLPEPLAVEQNQRPVIFRR